MTRVLGICLLMLSFNAAAAHTVETDRLQLRFSDTGDLLDARLCFPACAASESPRQVLRGTDPLVASAAAAGGSGWQYRRLDRSDDILIRFSRRQAFRQYEIAREGYTVRYHDNLGMSLRFSAGDRFGASTAPGFGRWLDKVRYLYISENDLDIYSLDEAQSKPVAVRSGQWLGFRNRFWTAMVQASAPADVLFGDGQDIAAFEWSQTSTDKPLKIYFGPVEPGTLRQAGPELGRMMYGALWFWLRGIASGLYRLLSWIQQLIPNWGLAIILLSICVKILMWPLNRIADRFQREVNDTQARLEPGIAAIKREYKGEEQANRILALHKEHGVTPLYSLKSLFGVAVLIPVFIGAFDMLAENIHLAGEPFLWIGDLAHPDAVAALPFTLPFFGGQLNLLPFLMAGFSIATSYMHWPPAMSEDMKKRQFRNLLLMAIAFFVLFYTFPAGMVLYWTVNNLISVIKDVFFRWHNRPASAA